MIAVILAGGSSARMKQNKALLRWHGLPLITHVSLALRFVFDRIIVSTNDPDLFRFLGLLDIPDLYPGAGPMAGIHAALAHASDEPVFVVGCDMPLLSPEIIRYLAAYPSHAPARVAAHRGRIHPLCGVYEQHAQDALEKHLQSKKGKLLQFIEEIGGEVLPVTPDLPCYSPDAFRNINTPRDLVLLRSRPLR